MKKIILICLLAQISLIASAQFRIGATIGLNFSNISSTNALEFPSTSLLTRNTLVQFGFGITEKLSFNLETGFGGKGMKLGGENNSLTSTSFRVIGLDLMPSLEFRPIKRIGLGVGMYGTLSFAEFIRFENQPWELISGNDFFKPFDFGLHTYARCYFKFIFIQVGYDHGLVDVFELNFTDVNGQSLGLAVGQFRDFRIGLGVLVELKK